MPAAGSTPAAMAGWRWRGWSRTLLARRAAPPACPLPALPPCYSLPAMMRLPIFCRASHDGRWTSWQRRDIPLFTLPACEVRHRRRRPTRCPAKTTTSSCRATAPTTPPLSPLSSPARSARVCPDRLSVAHQGQDAAPGPAKTYAALAGRPASALAQRGVGVGDTVAAMLPNTPPMFEVSLRRAHARRRAQHPEHPTGLRRPSLSMLDHGEARVLITDREFSATIGAALALMAGDLSPGGGRGRPAGRGWRADRRAGRRQALHRTGRSGLCLVAAR